MTQDLGVLSERLRALPLPLLKETLINAACGALLHEPRYLSPQPDDAKISILALCQACVPAKWLDFFFVLFFFFCFFFLFCSMCSIIVPTFGVDSFFFFFISFSPPWAVSFKINICNFYRSTIHAH
jgi:hypothetical protein